MGAKVLSQKKKSSQYQLRTSMKLKLTRFDYYDNMNVGLGAAILYRKRYSSHVK